MQIGFNAPTSGAADRAGQSAPHHHRGRGARFRLRDGQRPHHGAAQSGVEISLYRQRRIPGRYRGGLARTAHHHRVHRRADLEAALRAVGDGGAASSGGADREDARHDRLPVEGPPHSRHRRRLVPRGVRGDRRRTVRRSRPRHRRMDDGLQGAVVARRSALRRQVCEVLRRRVHAEAGAAADPDLGRRRERAGAATHRALRRLLVSGRHQSAIPDEHGQPLQGWPGAVPWLRREGRPRSREPRGRVACSGRARPRDRAARSTARRKCSPAVLPTTLPTSRRSRNWA